jgi:hypothetical protein
MSRETRGMLMGAAIVVLAMGWYFLKEKPPAKGPSQPSGTTGTAQPGPPQR